ncbi:hypothetical protein M378DRAFT_88183 [Amanita muscaria Koide BX008]|uniref:Uncharacterized protein n=1 Tax=Amanita muscaria (strain Koide BX008) TaxID=946122 RepID=A0A0C2WLZ6_AMAMK|nr:hypothetical protein M378DRAFT_172041 [Amanita muscaria Koide BX008]KIL57223.1 hypothetical protein M378DRAFT_88183 [Amanita muscaria Koide BX008]
MQVVANLFNWLLYGVLTVQLYLYYLAFPNDRAWTKAAVYTVYVLETIQVIGLSSVLLSLIVTDDFSSHDSWLSFASFPSGVPFNGAGLDHALLVHVLLVDFVGGLCLLISAAYSVFRRIIS